MSSPKPDSQVGWAKHLLLVCSFPSSGLGTQVAKLQLGGITGKLELPTPSSQAGAWEPS